MSGWIGVDLDGTLAKYEDWIDIEHIGEPIPLMLDRVKDWLSKGIEVRIFTARMAGGQGRAGALGTDRVEKVIQDWLEKQGLPRLKVTNVKDFGMIELWDDRAVGVVFNTGLVK